MGKNCPPVPRFQGGRKLPDKSPITALVNMAVRNECTVLFPGRNHIHIRPYPMVSVGVITIPLAIQQHKHRAVSIGLQQPVQHVNICYRIPCCVKILVVQDIGGNGQVIPVEVQSIVQIDPDLRCDLYKLCGTLFENPGPEVFCIKTPAHNQRQQ